MLHIFAMASFLRVRDKPLELTLIAGSFATNSSNRAFRRSLGDAATTEHLQIGAYHPKPYGPTRIPGSLPMLFL
jgi:hypothetical protein